MLRVIFYFTLLIFPFSGYSQPLIFDQGNNTLSIGVIQAGTSYYTAIMNLDTSKQEQYLFSVSHLEQHTFITEPEIDAIFENEQLTIFETTVGNTHYHSSWHLLSPNPMIFGLQTITINSAPELNAGEDQAVSQGDSVTLTANITDPDNNIAHFSWKDLSGLIDISDPQQQTIHFTAPNLTDTPPLLLSFELTVTDTLGVSAKDTVTITVEPLPPYETGADENYQLEIVISNVTVPWGMVQLPNGDMLFSERSGQLFLVRKGQTDKQNISGLPDIHANKQGGLLDLELHPEYEENGWLYFSYASPEGEGSGSNTAIMRAKLSESDLTDQQLIYKATPNTQSENHYGSRIEFDSAAYLYFSIGDRGNRDVNPQDLSLDGGKIYRLYDDGRIPEDNPFINDTNAIAAVYSYGHRNPQGLAMHPLTGKIWSHEHGPMGGDETNIIDPGNNYGWPVITYGLNYDGTIISNLTEKEGMEQPLWYWVPSIAPSGMAFITSDIYPEWQGHLIIGSLKFDYLVLCWLEGDKIVDQEILFEDIGRVRNIRQAADGYLYVATDENAIVKVVPRQ